MCTRLMHVSFWLGCLLAMGAMSMVSAQAVDPEKILREIVKAHREAPTLELKIGLTIEMAEGEQKGRGREIEGKIIRRKDGQGLFVLNGYTMHIAARQLQATHESNGEQYFSRDFSDYPFWALFSAFGGFQRIPFPHLALLWGSDDLDELCMELYADTPELKPHAVVDSVNEAGETERALELTSDDATMRIVFDPETFLIRSIVHTIRGGFLVPAGTVMTNRYKVETTRREAPVSDELIALVPGERERVDALGVLDQTQARPPVVGGGGGEPEIGVGKVAPTFVLTTLEGERIDLAELRGRVVVIDFWATWCGPCLVLMPGLDEVTRWAANRELPVLVLAINTYENAGENDSAEDRMKVVNEFWREHRYAMKVPMDFSNAVAQQYGVTGIPTSFVIGPDGVIRAHHIGGSPNYVETLKKDIEEALSM